MNKCVILMGMSGSLKMTTLNSHLYQDYFKIYSDTKSFFELDELYFNWSARVNDCHLAIHRLLTLSLPGYIPNDKNIIIERGVTDNIFCVPNRKLSGLESYDDMKISDLVKLESDLITKGRNISIEKVLLIMKDEEFIINKVLNGPDSKCRKAIYPDIATYMKKQDEYVNFTSKWNHLDKIVEINDAQGYIEDTLNLNYNNHGKITNDSSSSL